MNRFVMIAGATLLVAGLTGCTSIAGTWVADKSEGAASPIACVTYANDGTFTAAEERGEHSHAASGHYMYTGGKLVLKTDGRKREYAVAVEGNTMVVTYEGKQYRMTRMKSCCSACSCCQ